MDLTNLQRGPADKMKKCFWRTRKGMLTPINYWDCIDPKTGEQIRLIEFHFLNELGEPDTSLQIAATTAPNFVLISDLQFV